MTTPAGELVSAVTRVHYIKTIRESCSGLLVSVRSSPPQRISQDPCTKLHGIYSRHVISVFCLLMCYLKHHLMWSRSGVRPKLPWQCTPVRSITVATLKTRSYPQTVFYLSGCLVSDTVRPCVEWVYAEECLFSKPACLHVPVFQGEAVWGDTDRGGLWSCDRHHDERRQTRRLLLLPGKHHLVQPALQM